MPAAIKLSKSISAFGVCTVLGLCGESDSATMFLVSFTPSVSPVQLVEQRLRLFQVGGVEALAEPAVDFGEDHARLIRTTLLCEQAR